jgi:hypothetical protein
MGDGRVLSVNVGVPRANPARGSAMTGIDKRPVDGPVQVRPPGPKRTGLHSGLVGDPIGDTANHGGDDQAVYAYAGRTSTGGSGSWGASWPAARSATTSPPRGWTSTAR